MFCSIHVIFLWQTQKFKDMFLLSLRIAQANVSFKETFACAIFGKIWCVCLRACLHERDPSGLIDKPEWAPSFQREEQSHGNSWNQTNLKWWSVLGKSNVLWGLQTFFIRKYSWGSAKSELALLRYRQISFGCNGSLDTHGTVSLVILFWYLDVLGLMFLLNFFIDKVLLIVCGLTWRKLREYPCVIFFGTMGEFSIRWIDLSIILHWTSPNWCESVVTEDSFFFQN